MDDRFGLETATGQSGVVLSDDQAAGLLHYVELLRKWQARQNLVSRDTLHGVWSRHIADSLQLVPLIERWRQSVGGAELLRGVDLGSGGGLPGAVLAISTAGDAALDAQPRAHMTLIEATHRKGSFLRTVSRETNAPFDVLIQRLETIVPAAAPRADFVTARALAPLVPLVKMASPWLTAGATAFFHKGGEYARELDQWPDADDYNVVEHISVVDPKSRILQITRRDKDS